MVSIPEHKRRLVALGEHPDRIHVVGAPSLDRIVEHDPMPREELLKRFGIDDQPYAVVIFHPQDREIKKSSLYLDRIVTSIHKKGLFCFVGYPNTDPGNKNIIQVLDRLRNSEMAKVYKNLDREIFLSMYKNACIQVGNSSSGIIEAASIPLPVVNVGKRQRDRKAGKNVIFTGTTQEDIDQAVDRALSESFRESIQDMKNIYGDGKSTKRVKRLIKEINVENFLYKTEDPLEVAQSNQL
jgi:UDP-N-acetylglucosamine 2-epimerase (non-hydrolysing)/GDP/UDP-N,N'-diacetylbacillosamine 2-epimerase (hydrolysing)